MRALKISNSITNRDQKSIENYLNEISRYEVLSPEMELELFQRYRNGDEVAFEKIIKHNLRFVVSVAKQYQHMGMWLGDLVNEGNIGLIKAARRFDETKGFKFISYAVWWIRQCIMQALNTKSRKIRLPQSLKGQYTDILSHRRAILQEKEREPSPTELAEATGYSVELVRKCLTSFGPMPSLDAPITGEDDSSLVDVLPEQKLLSPDHHLLVIESQQKEVEGLLRQLSPREALVLKYYYGINEGRALSLDDISEFVGVSRERVRQIKDRALRRLRRRNQSMLPSLS